MINAENLPGIVGLLAWPATVVAIVLLFFVLFHGDISALLKRLRSAKVGDKEAAFMDPDVPNKGPNLQEPRVDEPSPLPVAPGMVVATEVATNQVQLTDASKSNEKQDIQLDWTRPFEQGNYKEAYGAFVGNAPANVNPNDTIKDKAFAAWLLSKSNFNQGLDELRTLVREYPSNMSVLIWLARAYRDQGLYDEAISGLNAGLKVVSSTDVPTLILEKCLIYEEMKKYGEALSLAEEALGSTLEPSIITSMHLLRGRVLKSQGQKDAASIAYYQAYLSDPTSAYIASISGSYFNELKDYKTELFFRQRAVTLSPQTSDYWGWLGNTYYLLDLFGLALGAYEKSLELVDKPVEWVHANLGNLYNRFGLHPNAIKHLQIALEGTPQDGYAVERLAEAVAMRQTEDNKAYNMISEAKTSLSILISPQPPSSELKVPILTEGAP